MVAYLMAVLLPYVDQVCSTLNVGVNQAALAIFDHFNGHLTPRITQILEVNNTQSVLVPPGYINRLQPLDVTVNRSAKCFLRSEFQIWYANEIADYLNSNDVEEVQPVGLSTARMKCLGAQWLAKVVAYLSDSRQIIANGFIASGKTPSIDYYFGICT